MRLIRTIGSWLDARLQLGSPIRATMQHPIPRETASWFYVFGSAAMTVLAFQLVTGILLALIYVPSAGEAWNSLQILNHQVAYGWFIRALHGWGSNFMLAIVLIHMVQVFLFGAYKFPRELTWIIGIFLLLMTLGMAFTGQVLRFDQDAYWGLGIGASISSRIPIVGPVLVKLLLGGPIIAGVTLSRFFAFHVFVIPGLLIGFVGLHVLLVLKLGINEWPMPGRLVRRADYMEKYHHLTHTEGVPFVPNGVWKDAIFSGVILIAIAACALYFGPFGPSGQPDPRIIQTAPRPDFFFLWLYALLSLLPPAMETPVLLIGPAIALVVLLALPFFSGEGEKSWRRRPIAVLTILLSAVTLGTFTNMADHAAWSPVVDASTAAAIPAKLVTGRTPLEVQGALVFQSKQCHNCHSLGDIGGKRGPALDAVAVRLTGDQLVRQVLQGGGNMPAYGKNLNPAETTARRFSRDTASSRPNTGTGRFIIGGNPTVTWRVSACAAGLAVLWMATASPLAHLDHHFLTAHMVMHLLLMTVAAPLILFGVRPALVRWHPQMTACWLAGTLTVLLWHVPAVFELGLQSPFWHLFEVASFLVAGIVFWWPVMQTHPNSRWSVPVYLFLATLPCDALSAFLVFCGHVVYRPYFVGNDHGMFSLSPLEDQALAGALMWVTVTFAYLIPALVLTARLLSSERTPASELGVG